MRRGTILAIMVISMAVAACAYPGFSPPQRQGVRVGARYLRQWNPNVARVARTLQSAIAGELAKRGNLPPGYPRDGAARRLPSSDKNVWQVECAPSGEAAGKDACLLLKPTGEHIRVSWLENGQTDSRFYPFTVYVLGIWPWQTLDRITTQRVVIDIEHPNDAASAAVLLSLYDTVGEALAAAGASELRD